MRIRQLLDVTNTELVQCNKRIMGKAEAEETTQRRYSTFPWHINPNQYFKCEYLLLALQPQKCLQHMHVIHDFLQF